MEKDLIELSRTIAYALRHRPEEFGLALDGEGWVLIEELLAAIKRRQPGFAWAEPQSVEQIIDQSDKQRFELLSGSIRALYGHSLGLAPISRAAAVPPPRLYHGTTPKAAAHIAQEGLRPMRRHLVHLSLDRETAVIVGQRRCPVPVILTIDATAAHAAGVAFYPGNEQVWLAEPIPPQFILTAQEP